MEVATNMLEFLQFKLKFDKESQQISVDVFAKVPVVQIFSVVCVFL